MKIDNYVVPDTLEEADQILHADPKNYIIGGLMGLGTSSTRLHTAIDLKKLNLNRIIVEKNSLRIGALCTLSDLEEEVVPENLRKIFYKGNDSVGGKQMRNAITVGGIVCSRYGKSNLLTIFSAAKATLHFYRQGEVEIDQYLSGKAGKDLLLEVIIKEIPKKMVFDAIYYDKADMPVLNCAAALTGEERVLAVGARPGVAKIIRKSEEITYGSDLRATASYRKQVAPILFRRVQEALENDSTILDK